MISTITWFASLASITQASSTICCEVIYIELVDVLTCHVFFVYSHKLAIEKKLYFKCRRPCISVP